MFLIVYIQITPSLEHQVMNSTVGSKELFSHSSGLGSIPVEFVWARERHARLGVASDLCKQESSNNQPVPYLESNKGSTHLS